VTVLFDINVVAVVVVVAVVWQPAG